MDDNEFRERSDTALSKVAKWLEDLDPDEVDYTTADGVVTIEFAGGAKFILSRQSQMKQMWLAAGSHGFHYNWTTRAVRGSTTRTVTSCFHASQR
ncbi:MAG TPA: iron donor protein CyaY [Candidatus Acidoferrum sp.]|nr:iron donor protein CyaY [Candidatus Acidoferrum sp.]